MALNPFFLQGSQSEQSLVQELINEQLKMYGVDVTYLPRKVVNRDSIFREIESSKFDDSYTLEAYVNTYEGYSGQGDVMSKFGLSIKDELTLTISRERYEDFITPFLESETDSEIVLSNRPREGDLVYFPLGQRLFEVKFVEHEDPFYQLGKNYVYLLKCELFEYEDEVIDTGVDVIDTQVEEEGYITTLKLVGSGQTASASALINTKYVRELFLNNDGNGYKSPPIIKFDDSPLAGGTATAIGILTTRGGITSLKSIQMTNAGYGYTSVPQIYFTSDVGTGAAATCSIESSDTKGVIAITVTDGGTGYTSAPDVTIGNPTAGAAATATVSETGTITAITLSTGGVNYIDIPSVTIANPPSVGVGVGTTAVGIASVTAGIVTTITITNAGFGYTNTAVPSVTIDNSVGIKTTTSVLTNATAVATITTGNIVNAIRVVNPGVGYTQVPTVTIANPPLITGIGTYQFNEEVVGSTSGARARVKNWNEDTGTLKIDILNGLDFSPGELVVGSASSATYATDTFDDTDIYDEYNQGDEIETEADLLLDFTQSNPFGTY
mgnify:CR=1 FL=1|tara:strand:+ start:719 stop:2380 length:1662 start_codon:yes stop_codon:yes gene_type:complete